MRKKFCCLLCNVLGLYNTIEIVLSNLNIYYVQIFNYKSRGKMFPREILPGFGEGGAIWWQVLYSSQHCANQHTKNFRNICSWVDDQIEETGYAEMEDMKEKYVELTASASKCWTSLNTRIKKNLHLVSQCRREKVCGQAKQKVHLTKMEIGQEIYMYHIMIMRVE